MLIVLRYTFLSSSNKRTWWKLWWKSMCKRPDLMIVFLSTLIELMKFEIHGWSWYFDCLGSHCFPFPVGRTGSCWEIASWWSWSKAPGSSVTSSSSLTCCSAPSWRNRLQGECAPAATHGSEMKARDRITSSNPQTAGEWETLTLSWYNSWLHEVRLYTIVSNIKLRGWLFRRLGYRIL